jgi:hypothetical protein
VIGGATIHGGPGCLFNPACVGKGPYIGSALNMSNSAMHISSIMDESRSQVPV